MGIDHDGVGGIGIEVTEEIINKAIELGMFTQDEWEQDSHECCEKFGLMYDTAGNYFTTDLTHYLFVGGDNLSEILDHADDFIQAIYDKFGMTIDLADLKVVSDSLVS